MARYVIRYTTQDGDFSGCWVEADTKDEAINAAYDEHCDIDNIVSVSKQ